MVPHYLYQIAFVPNTHFDYVSFLLSRLHEENVKDFKGFAYQLTDLGNGVLFLNCYTNQIIPNKIKSAIFTTIGTVNQEMIFKFDSFAGEPKYIWHICHKAGRYYEKDEEVIKVLHRDLKEVAEKYEAFFIGGTSYFRNRTYTFNSLLPFSPTMFTEIQETILKSFDSPILFTWPFD